MSLVAIGSSTNTGYNNGRKIITDNNGNMYICYYTTLGGYTQVVVVKSTDGGNTWIDMGFPQVSGYNQQSPSMAIDSDGKLHVVWCGCDVTNATYTQIKYSNNVSGSWSTWENIQVVAGYNQQTPSITIDSNNKCHVVWHGCDATNTTYTQIKYSNNISGSWSSWENIQVISTKTQTNPCMLIDSNNKCHVVWYGTDATNTTISQIKYSNNASGSWSTWENIQLISTKIQQYPSMAIDSDGKLHVVWCGTDSSNTSYSQIKYSNNVNGTWSGWENIQVISSYSQQCPHIAIDSNNKCHVVWHGCDSINTSKTQIKYSNNISGTWSSWVNVSSGGVVVYINPVCVCKNDKIYCVFAGGSSSIEIITRPFILSNIKYLISDRNNILFNSVSDANTVLDLIPIMTSNTAPSGTASASSIGSATYDAWKAFDDIDTTFWRPANSDFPVTIGYAFTSPIVVNMYTITPYTMSITNVPPKNWTFEGSNDGTTWTVLDTKTNYVNWSSGVRQVFKFVNYVAYTQYRLNISENVGGTYTAIQEFELMKYSFELDRLNTSILTDTIFTSKGIVDITSINNQEPRLIGICGQNNGTLGTGKYFEFNLDSVFKSVNNIS